MSRTKFFTYLLLRRTLSSRHAHFTIDSNVYNTLAWNKSVDRQQQQYNMAKR